MLRKLWVNLLNFEKYQKSKTNYMRLFKILALNLLFALISFSSFGQGTFYLPDGYQTYKDDNENEVRCDGDFDHDGKKDLAILAVNSDESQAIIIVYLTTRYLENGIYSWFPWELWVGNNDLVYENDILIISQQVGFGSNYTFSVKFKFYDNLKTMRLINFYREVDFKVDEDINLLTGDYEEDGKKGKSNFDIITLSDIEKGWPSFNTN